MYEVFGTKAPHSDDKKIIPNRIGFGNKHSFPLNQKGSSIELFQQKARRFRAGPVERLKTFELT
jgi:hypothetical protein